MDQARQIGFEPGGSDQRLLHETYILIILKIVNSFGSPYLLSAYSNAVVIT